MKQSLSIIFKLIIGLILINLGCTEENKKPSCNIISPVDGTSISSGDTIEIVVESDDSDGTIFEVNLFVNNENIGFISSSPYKYEWKTAGVESGDNIIKAIAYDNEGSLNSDEIGISITATLPIILTDSIHNITLNSANCDGIIVNSGGETIIGRGICWSNNQNPTIEDNKTNDNTTSDTCTSTITGLASNTTFYIRAYATSSKGTSYGIQKRFTTYGLTDIDGNFYHTIEIGDQIWMAENLKTSKFNDGVEITLFNDDQLYSADTYGYIEDFTHSGNENVYGALYNWLVVNTNKVCPSGWHVPSINEWYILRDYLGGYSVAGGEMKEAGTAHWNSPNVGATNSSGFTALPGGYKEYYQGANAGGNIGKWWSTDPYGSWHARDIVLESSEAGLDVEYIRRGSMCSVRCIKD